MHCEDFEMLHVSWQYKQQIPAVLTNRFCTVFTVMLLNESIKDYQENKKSISVSIWVHRGVEQIALDRQSRLVTPCLLDLNT